MLTVNTMIIHGSEFKKDIDDDPLLRYFRADINRNGYWNSLHVKLQLDDVVDFLVIIFPTFDYMFLFDQRSGHTKLREDGLVTRHMNVSYGSVASYMHDTTIKEPGPYPTNFSIDSVQQMSFTDDDAGLFWLDVTAQQHYKYDRVITGSTNKEQMQAPSLV